MDSPQSVVSPLKNSGNSAAAEKPEVSKPNGNHHRSSQKSFIGALSVFIHSARDIHNICIYHKQDVYAKLSLSSDPETSVSSTIINGGGQNPVFNDRVNLRVTTIEASLRCEIWMMSRVRNYLEDQLLGFALVPLSEVLVSDGKLEKEFTLSSTDLFHSPAGFIRLSIDYSGAKPAVVIAPGNAGEPEISESSPIGSELDRIEFPDPKIINEDEIMVSEYIAMPCGSLESDAAAAEPEAEAGSGSPVSSESVNGVSSPPLEKATDPPESGSSGGSRPAVLTIEPEPEPEPKVVQQDIVDMYMKSMQQFTESLAKMKLPLDIEAGSGGSVGSGGATPSPTTNSGENSSSDSKGQTGKNTRVFYGSRAFF